MSIIRTGPHSDDDRGGYRSPDEPRGLLGLLRVYFAPLVRAVAEHGLRGLLAIVVAATIAFAPAGLLVWFNHLRFAPVIELKPGQTVIVKPERHEHQQREEQPGETSLLSIACEIPSNDGPVPLLIDDDPARPNDFLAGSRYISDEQAYLRPVISPPAPFGLLGRPPVSVWLPPGEYEVVVIYSSPHGIEDDSRGDRGFPLLSAAVTCTTADREKTSCRIFLSHHEDSYARQLSVRGADGRTAETPAIADLRELLDGIERAKPVPTPAGYLLDLPEPAVRHDADHYDCAFDYSAAGGAPREWTRNQLSTLLHWLPADEAARPARERLEKLIAAIEWRDYFRGWYLYAAAGVAGLIFTRWGATAVVEPWRRKQSFFESAKTLLAIFLFAAGMWLLWAILTDSGGCRGPTPFRIR